jgi:hypothetical protein
LGYRKNPTVAHLMEGIGVPPPVVDKASSARTEKTLKKKRMRVATNRISRGL